MDQHINQHLRECETCQKTKKEKMASCFSRAVSRILLFYPDPGELFYVSLGRTRLLQLEVTS